MFLATPITTPICILYSVLSQNGKGKAYVDKINNCEGKEKRRWLKEEKKEKIIKRRGKKERKNLI